MTEDKQSSESGQGKGKFAFLLAGTIDISPQTMTYSGESVEEIVSAEITKRVQIPIVITTAVLCAVLSVSAVVVGIIILVIPFTIGCAFSVYAVYTLRESTLEEPDITNYAVIGDTEGQSAFPPARTEILSGSAVDSMQENASIHEKK